MNFTFFLRAFKKSSIGFFYNNGFLLSKALSFQTLFCLVPSFLLLLFLTSMLEVFQIPLFKIEEFITTSFIPEPFQHELISHIKTAFENSKSVFTIVLGIFLIATFSLSTDIHDAFYVLSYKTQRIKLSFFIQLSIYIFIIAGFLIILIMDFFLGTVFLKNIEISELPNYLLKFFSFIISSFFLYCIYQSMSPISIFKIHTAIVSCLVSGIFLFGQKLFLLYLSWFPGYMLVYGAIATLPILFFWVYLHWMIILNGYTLLLELSSSQKAQIKKQNFEEEIY